MQDLEIDAQLLRTTNVTQEVSELFPKFQGQFTFPVGSLE